MSFLEEKVVLKILGSIQGHLTLDAMVIAALDANTTEGSTYQCRGGLE